jgi:hypothetical protein
VKSYAGAPLYDEKTLRTFFLEFASPDWEKELADFKNTDVEVPAKLTVDGRTYPDVGVHFRGSTSYMMVSEGRKRPLNLTLDFVHRDQHLGGYRTLNLLNSHEDPSFLRTVLAYHIAREYFPAPKANYVRVVINGESWGIYINVQQCNKDFGREWFGTTQGARWKVPGNPGGQGGLGYLGDDVAPYKRIYEIKTKDDPRSWGELIRLCKLLQDTPPEHLERTLAPALDIEGTLKFLALDNVLVNGDGFWTRASDYFLYLDATRRFHLIPYDINETFSEGGGPGGPGGRGGPGGMRGFGPGMFVAPQIFTQADKDADRSLTEAEFLELADAWYDKLDADQAGKLGQEQFVAGLNQVLPPPQGFGPPGGGRGGFGPAMFLGPGLYAQLDADHDGSLTRAELKDSFAKWFGEWDAEKRGALTEENLRDGLNAALPRPDFRGFGGGRGGGPGRPLGSPGQGRGDFAGGPGGPGGPLGGPREGGIRLDPLVSTNDTSKPLLSRLLAAPALRQRYLGYVREIAERWLDWRKLGPLAEQYHALIAADMKTDTRKIDSTEAFLNSLVGETQEPSGSGGPGFFGGAKISLKGFADQRRAFLLDHPAVKNAARSDPKTATRTPPLPKPG